MPRKKSTSGRAKTTKSLYYEVERANRKLSSLEKADLLGTYASKKLLRDLDIPQLQGAVTVSRGKKSKRRSRAIVKVRSNISRNSKLYVQKRIREFNKSETSTVTGVARRNERVSENVRKGLSKFMDKKLDQQDLQDFYDLLYDKDYKAFEEKIGYAPEIYQMLYHARDNESEEMFIKALKQKMTLNSKTMQKKAKRLYNKFVNGEYDI